MAGEADKIKGRAKQAIGDLTGDDDLEREGELDEAAAEVKETLGDIEEGAKDAVDDVRERLND